MLSYRHSFHAGNFADIIKHVVLVEILDHLTQKEAPFEYIDTHAGAGLFNLDSSDARKLQEHNTGIAKLKPADFPELARYFEIIGSYNKTDTLRFYPGSPSITRCLLRPQDRAWLFELHPQDYKSLCNNMKNEKKVRVSCQDGLIGMTALLPPACRRGLVLIDPSYEVKSEYDQVFDAVVKAVKRFSTGIYAIWYPVVDRKKINNLERKLVASGIKNIQRFELGLSPDSGGRGMRASGIFVINPPWKLFNKMSDLLPKLARTLGEKNEHFFKCDIIASE